MDYERKYYRPEDEKALCQFYVQMNADCNCNHTRIVWEWLRNAPYFEMFQLEKNGIWIENNEIVASIQLQSPWPGYVKVDNRSSSEDLLLEITRPQVGHRLVLKSPVPILLYSFELIQKQTGMIYHQVPYT